MAPTPEQIQLIRDHEPALYFVGQPGQPGAERFFPSDAKRYLEHCALYRARDPFKTRADWGTPIVEAGKLGAIDGEMEVFIGQQTGGIPDFLAAPQGQEGFLVVREPSAGVTSGWDQGVNPEDKDRHADLDRLAARYEEAKLKESRFWYHGEFFDAARLRRLFGDAMDPGGNPIDFNQLFAPRPDGPPTLSDPALICYYLFYPGHEESLAGCISPDGTLYVSAEDFGSFAGEWSCIAILLDRTDPAAAYAPKWVGMSNRNIGVIKVGDREVRVGMRILPWSAMQTFEGAHPRFAVAQGNHTLYLPGETTPPVVPLTSADPGAAFCGSATAIVGPSNTLGGNPFAGPILVGKVVAGAAAGGGIFGPIGAGLGAAAGTVWGIAELTNPSSSDQITYVQPATTPTVDATSSGGLVIHPVGKKPAEVDAGRAVEWKNIDNFAVGDRKYPWVVDRETQVLWGEDPDKLGYTGRWGPRVAEDEQTRRAGMKFPKFWEVFFDALVRNDAPSRVIVLKRDSGTAWKVPDDWNNANNSIECIGGGGGGVGGGVGVTGAGGSGGGGGYSKIERIALTPGAFIAFGIGVGGAAGAVGTAAGGGGETFFNGASLAASAVSARGGGGANGTLGGSGGGAEGAVGATKSPGGTGAAGGVGLPAGAGGGGAAGRGGAGLNGASATRLNFGGGGGGGNGGGAAGATGATGDTGNNGGNGAGGTGGGAGGAAGTVGGAGIAGGGGGGGGGPGPAGACGAGGAGGGGDEFDGSHGSGGGGGGGGGNSGAAGSTGGNGGAGGLYGGGGGGGGFVAAGTAGQGGKGADGVIVIRYTP